jgi:hypothetical protein
MARTGPGNRLMTPADQAADSQAGSSRRWKAAAAALVAAALPGSSGDPATWPAWAVLLPHARAVLPAAAQRPLIRYLGSSGSPAAARDLASRLLPEITAELGAGHRVVLAARAELALWTGAAGDPAAFRRRHHRCASRAQRRAHAPRLAPRLLAPTARPGAAGASPAPCGAAGCAPSTRPAPLRFPASPASLPAAWPDGQPASARSARKHC